LSKYEIIDVSEWEDLGREQMGTKPRKTWLKQRDEKRKWLFKPVTRHGRKGDGDLRGDDWSEKLSTEVAIHLAIPVARTELAIRKGVSGIISLDVTDGSELVPGNVVMFATDSTYPFKKTHGVERYTIKAVYEALEKYRVTAPHGFPIETSGKAAFATYLGLDALIGNTDRHHENWGILIRPNADRIPLAPSFDHASSLGFQLSEQEFAERTATNDVSRSVLQYAKAGRSRHFAGRPSLLDLALEAFAADPGASALFADRLEMLTGDTIKDLVNEIPDEILSHSARTFIVELLLENRRRLSDGLHDA
jgi:hypothetical protein